jgi:TRAP-type C4-dicarboxylate transport system permease small subunit
MRTLIKCGNVIKDVENWLAIITFTAMICVVIAIVLCRYVFEVRFTEGEEIARYLMIWCGYAGAAIGFREHSHVGVVVFTEMFPESWQPIIIKIRHFLSTIIVIFLLFTASLCFNQFIESGKLTTATKIPTAAVYVIIPIALVFGIIHTTVDIANDYIPKGGKLEGKEGVAE